MLFSQIGRLTYELSGYGTSYYSTPIIPIDNPIYGGLDGIAPPIVAKRDFIKLINNDTHLAFRKEDGIQVESCSVPICHGTNKRTGQKGDFSVYHVVNKNNDVNFKLFSDFALYFNGSL